MPSGFSLDYQWGTCCLWYWVYMCSRFLCYCCCQWTARRCWITRGRRRRFIWITVDDDMWIKYARRSNLSDLDSRGSRSISFSFVGHCFPFIYILGNSNQWNKMVRMETPWLVQSASSISPHNGYFRMPTLIKPWLISTIKQDIQLMEFVWVDHLKGTVHCWCQSHYLKNTWIFTFMESNYWLLMHSFNLQKVSAV